MVLSSGAKLGPYEIVAPLGAGGMGEVYRARDTRLDRIVAIKILPAHLSQNAEAKERFDREARAISSLGHPNICHLYDVGHQDGMDYLVMECLEGETLAKRLEKGPLLRDQVLRFGTQIADALDQAHRSGIVHRDLKPGNIMLTPTGAKLLDFGLAKPAAPLTSAATLTAATQQSPMTAQGTIVGTFQYMSPEQIEGKELDGRSDIFSLGAVLYEMFTGQGAFPGKSQLSVASAIVEKEPAPISIDPMTPPALDHALRRCLAKDPEERWQTARDLKHELQWLAETDARFGTMLAPASRLAKLLPIYAVLTTLVALTLAGFIWRQSSSPRQTPPAVRFMLTLPASDPLAVTSGPALAFAPDGRRIAYVVHHGDTTQLYLREMASFEGKLLQGTEGAAQPFFSPDGEWLGFVANGKLKKIPAAGGPAMVLCDAPESNGAVWLPDGSIIFNADWREGLRRVSAAGGESEVLTHPDLRRGEAYHWWPEVLPSGEAVLFTDQKGPSHEEASIAVLSLKTREWRTVIDKGSNPHYLPSGHIVYLRGDALLAAPFDPNNMKLTGPSFPVLQGVLLDSDFSIAQMALSRGGAIVYVPGTVARLANTLMTVDRFGRERPLTDLRRPYEDLTLSPDGRYLALTIMGELWNVWLFDLARGTLSRITFEGDNRDPVWTADSKHVIYVSFRNGRSRMFWKPITVSDPEKELLATESLPWPYSCSRDGHWLSYALGAPSPEEGVYLLPLDGKQTPKPVVLEPMAQGGAISPDGEWMAYESIQSGRSEVYVRPLSPEAPGKWQISTEGGIRPRWSTNGHELFFRSGTIRSNSTLMSVAVQTEPAFLPAPPRPLFKFRYAQAGHDYAVTPDGQHFICIKESERDTGPTQLNVILNWTAELKTK